MCVVLIQASYGNYLDPPLRAVIVLGLHFAASREWKMARTPDSLPPRTTEGFEVEEIPTGRDAGSEEPSDRDGSVSLRRRNSRLSNGCFYAVATYRTKGRITWTCFVGRRSPCPREGLDTQRTREILSDAR